ncbi:MAG: hypothetical protein WB808_13875 [Candidatus Dormiibacterota bacterium]
MPTSERAAAAVRAIASSAVLRAAPGLLGQSRWRGPRPAAVRIERSRVHGDDGVVADQTALTLWFGEGPSLSGVSVRGRATRVAVRTLAGVVATVAIGAASAFVARQEASRLGSGPRLLLREPGKDSGS